MPLVVCLSNQRSESLEGFIAQNMHNGSSLRVNKLLVTWVIRGKLLSSEDGRNCGGFWTLTANLGFGLRSLKRT